MRNGLLDEVRARVRNLRADVAINVPRAVPDAVLFRGVMRR